jgi:hypothetical protein
VETFFKLESEEEKSVTKNSKATKFTQQTWACQVENCSTKRSIQKGTGYSNLIGHLNTSHDGWQDSIKKQLQSKKASNMILQQFGNKKAQNASIIMNIGTFRLWPSIYNPINCILAIIYWALLTKSNNLLQTFLDKNIIIIVFYVPLSAALATVSLQDASVTSPTSKQAMEGIYKTEFIAAIKKEYESLESNGTTRFCAKTPSTAHRLNKIWYQPPKSVIKGTPSESTNRQLTFIGRKPLC